MYIALPKSLFHGFQAGMFLGKWIDVFIQITGTQYKHCSMVLYVLKHLLYIFFCIQRAYLKKKFPHQWNKAKSGMCTLLKYHGQYRGGQSPH